METRKLKLINLQINQKLSINKTIKQKGKKNSELLNSFVLSSNYCNFCDLKCELSPKSLL